MATKLGHSERLKTVFGFLKPADVLCDIGADHGLLVMAFARQYGEKVYATELNGKPLARLRDSVAKAALKPGLITIYRADGLEFLPTAVNAVTICGLGGATIARILQTGRENLKNVDKLIVEPQGHAWATRLALNEVGFRIVAEKYVAEKGRAYPVILAEKGAEARPYAAGEFMFGRLPVQDKDPLLKAYLDHTVKTLAPLLTRPKVTKETKTQDELAREALRGWDES